MDDLFSLLTLREKGSFPLRISSVNMTRSAVLLKKSLMENFIFCVVSLEQEIILINPHRPTTTHNHPKNPQRSITTKEKYVTNKEKFKLSRSYRNLFSSLLIVMAHNVSHTHWLFSVFLISIRFLQVPNLYIHKKEFSSTVQNTEIQNFCKYWRTNFSVIQTKSVSVIDQSLAEFGEAKIL